MQELHFTEKINWPDGYRMAVLLTFDFQGGEDVKRDKDGKINHEEWTQREYGPQTGIWRILRILDETRVNGTFLTCGAIAEGYPEAIKAIAQRGHEIAGHGYHHEVARDLTRDEEREVMRKTIEMIEKRARQAAGWLAFLHTEPQQPGTIDETRISLEQQFICS